MQRGRVGALVREFANSKQISAPRRAGAPGPWVRLLVPVHHRLRLLAFPMRTAPLTHL
jgi:hypothetical protein